MAPDQASPASRAWGVRNLTWTAYLFMACQGYLIYAVGFITPYVQADLSVPPWLAALPSSLMAMGIIVGGPVAGRAVGGMGSRPAVRLWAALMAASAVMLALPVSMVPILVGALLFGVSVAGMLVHVNSALGAGHGGTLLVRANTWAVAGGLLGPLVLSAAARSAGWATGALVPVPFLILLALILPGSPARDRRVADGAHEPGLSRAYWLTWMFLVLGIAAEFSFVAWGAQVVTARTGVALADATGLASLYVLGMVIGRLVLSTGFASGARNGVILRGCTGLAVLGSLLLWVATTPLPAAAGLLLGGLGLSAVYPLGATLALAHARHAPLRASARLTAASGSAIIVAPLVLGVAAGAVGVVAAWLIAFGFLGASLVVLLLVPRPPSTLPEPAETAPAGTLA